MKRVTSISLWLYVIGVVQMCALLAPAILLFGRPPHEPRMPGPPPMMHHQGFLPPPPVLNFLCGFVVIGIGTLLTGRWIVRPLVALAGAAQAFGKGDLLARAPVTRGDEIGKVAVAFNEMADRLRAALLAEKELLANVSHELRTPLARIRVALHIAGEGDRESTRASLLEIETDLVEIEAMLDDIFTATRVAMLGGPVNASAGFALRAEPLAPAAVVERARERFTSRHAARPLAIDVPGELPDVLGDPVLLRRVLDNLLENAHKYSSDPDAGIALRVATTAGAVVFDVVDAGDGIAAADLPKIFDPFFRSDRHGARRTGGIGLGLTLVKRIVEAHGGQVEVSSELGKETRVRVTVPRAAG